MRATLSASGGRGSGRAVGAFVLRTDSTDSAILITLADGLRVLMIEAGPGQCVGLYKIIRRLDLIMGSLRIHPVSSSRTGSDGSNDLSRSQPGRSDHDRVWGAAQDRGGMHGGGIWRTDAPGNGSGA